MEYLPDVHYFEAGQLQPEDWHIWSPTLHSWSPFLVVSSAACFQPQVCPSLHVLCTDLIAPMLFDVTKLV